jgi:D-alanyl-D-alanine carboxypeptidase
MFPLECFDKLAPSVIIGVWKEGQEIYKSDKTDHYVRIGSITKIFTAIVIKKLAKGGQIHLDDSARIYLNFDLPSDISIEHLVTMSSGIPDYNSSDIFLAACIMNPEMEWQPRQLVDIALKNPLKFKAGEKQMFSNTNYIILGLILEFVTEKSLEELYSEYILRPLKMNSTFLPSFSILPEPYLEGFQYVNKELRNVTKCHPSMAWSSGGLVSTLNNLYILAHELKNLLPFEKKIYGFGVGKFGDYYGHSGNFPGYSTILLVNPEKDIIIIVLTNLKQTIDEMIPSDIIANELMNLLLDIKEKSEHMTV